MGKHNKSCICLADFDADMDQQFHHAVPIRTPKQIEGIRRACRLGREVLDKAHAAIRPGVTTDEIDRVVSSLKSTYALLEPCQRLQLLITCAVRPRCMRQPFLLERTHRPSTISIFPNLCAPLSMR